MSANNKAIVADPAFRLQRLEEFFKANRDQIAADNYGTFLKDYGQAYVKVDSGYSRAFWSCWGALAVTAVAFMASAQVQGGLIPALVSGTAMLLCGGATEHFNKKREEAQRLHMFEKVDLRVVNKFKAINYARACSPRAARKESTVTASLA